MEKIKLIVKGFIIGIANIIPGVSGGTLALLLGVYEKILNVINTLFKNFKKNVSFILFLGIGLVVAILIGSVGVKAALENYKIITTLFFIGLIAGGIPLLYKKVDGKMNFKNIIIFLIVLLVMSLIIFLEGKKVSIETPNIFNYFELIIVGIIAAATMVIPGVSGSMVLMTIGYYDMIISCIANIMDFSNIMHNIQILLPFGIGCIIGILFIAKVLSWLLSRFETQTYFAIFGFIVASFVGMVYINITVLDYVQLAIGAVLGVLGFLGSYYLSKFEKKEGN